MNRPMTAKEIEVFDEVAISLMPKCTTEMAYKVALEAISCRRAALIADAYVGKRLNEYYWECRCNHSPNFGSNGTEQSYCEACHTRRPDEVRT